MAEGNVAINGNGFWLLPFERNGRSFLVDHFIFKQTVNIEGGLENPDARAGVWPRKFYPPYLGMGRRRLLRGKDGLPNPRDRLRYWDAEDMLTIWSDSVRLGLLSQDSTEQSGDTVVRVSAPFKGDFLSMWENTTAGPLYSLTTRQYNGSTTTHDGGAGTLEASSGTLVVGQDLMEHKDRIIGVYCDGANHVAKYMTTLGTWNAAATTVITTGLLSNSVTANEDIDAALLEQMSNIAIAILWHESNGTITFYDTSDGGDTWTDRQGDIASGNGPQGVAVMINPAGNQRLIVGTREALYEVDTSVNPYTHILIWKAPTRHNDNFRRMTVHSDGALWFGLGVDNNSPAPVGRMFIDGDHWRIEINERFDSAGSPIDVFLGPAAGDSCPATLLGPIKWWRSAGALLFASVGGGATSRNAWIMCHNGFGPHIFYKHATANQIMNWLDVSADDDGTPRLHFSMRTATDAADSQFLANPLSNPRDGQTYAYQLNGYLEPPEDNLDSADVPKNMINVNEDVEDLSASTSGEYINVDYGINGAAASGTDLGDFLSGTKTIAFGSNSEGVSALSIQVRENFIRDAGSTADTPKRRILTIRMEPRYTALNGWNLQIDLRKTAQERGTTPEAILAELNTIRDSVVMITFQYSPIAQTYVRMLDNLRVVEFLPTKITSDTTTTQRSDMIAFASFEER